MSSSRVVTRPPADLAVEVDPRRWWILGVACLAQLMVVLDVSIVNIALPDMQSSLRFSDASRGWIVTAYALAFGSLLLLGGRLSDLFGLKRMFLLGAVGFGAASGLGGAANSFSVLVTARVAQGLFGALLAPACLAALAVGFVRPAERAKAFGVYSGVSGVGGGVGLLIGGLLTESVSWRATMYVNVLLAIVAIVGGVLVMRQGIPGPRPVLDLPGTAMISVGLFALVLGLVDSETDSWGSPATWAPLGAGVLLVLAFALWQLRATHPLLPLRVLMDRNRAASLLGLLIGSAGTFSVFLFLTYYFQQTLNYSPIRAGLAFLPLVITTIIGSVVALNPLLPKLGAKFTVPLGMVVSVVGMIWLTSIGVGTGYATGLLGPLSVVGFGLGCIFAPAISLATSGVDESDAGVASAAVSTTQQVGGSLGIAVLSTVSAAAVAGYLDHHHPMTTAVMADASLSGFHTAFWWAVGMFGLGAITAASLYRRRPQPTNETSMAE